MSDEPRTSQPQSAPAPGVGFRIGFVAAFCVLGMLLAIVLFSFRVPLVFTPKIHEKLQSYADSYQFRWELEDITSAGLLCAKIENLTLSFERDEARLDMRFDSVTITPSLRSMIASRGKRPTYDLVVEQGDVRVALNKELTDKLDQVIPHLSREPIRDAVISDSVLHLLVSSASMQLDSRVLSAELDSVSIYRNDDKPGMWLLKVQLVHDRIRKTTSMQSRLADEYHGQADINVYWNHLRNDGWGSLASVQLDLGTLLHLASLPDSNVSGMMSGDFDLALSLDNVALQWVTQAKFHRFLLDASALASTPLEFNELGIVGSGALNPSARKFELPRGQLFIGALSPIQIRADFERTEYGWKYDLSANTKNLNTESLQAHIPRAIAGSLQDSQLRGSWSARLESSGYFDVPETVELNTTFEYNIAHSHASTYVPVENLSEPGPAPLDPSKPFAALVTPDTWMTLEMLPSFVPYAITAAEDVNFFSHTGIDWVGIRTALARNLHERQFVMGGSTLTQQLVKNLFLTHERTIARKLQESFLTWKIESTLSKERILELYVNIVEWGPDVYGIHAASDLYFNTSPQDLTIAEAALLASILPHPKYFGGRIKAGYLPASRHQKIQNILINLRYMGHLDWKEFRHLQEQLSHGQIGRLQLKVCPENGESPPVDSNC